MSQPIASVYQAEVLDYSRLLYRVPPGRILAVYEGIPGTPGVTHPLLREMVEIDHEERASESTFETWPARGGRCATYSPLGLIRLGAAPIFPISALVAGSTGSAEREREEAIQVLRDLCSRHGDLDWEPTLHLADILDKHLGRHLAGKTES